MEGVKRTKKEQLENAARMEFYKIFNGYECSQEELRRAWERYQEVKDNVS